MGEYINVNTTNAVKIDGRIVPGLLQGIEINGELRIESQSKDGESGSRQIVKGYPEATIRLDFVLLGDVHAQVRALQEMFAVTGLKARRVVNPHLDARGVRKLVFKGLSTRENADDDTLTAQLTFTEYDAEIRALEEKDRAAKAAKEGKPKKAKSGTGTGAAGPGSQVASDATAASGKTTGADGKPKTPGPLEAAVNGFGDGAAFANRLAGRGP